MTTRQQLEQQLVAAHRTGNVQAAQQAAYAIRQYDQNSLYAQVPSINTPPPIDRVPKPTFGDWLENVSYGWGKEYANQIQGLTDSVQRGVSAFAKDPLKASAAAFMTALEPARQGFTQPVQTAKDVGTGLVETGKQMYQQATSGPIGLGQTMGQLIDMPGPDLPGGKRRPTMAELDVYHGTPHTFDPEEGAPLGRFRSEKIGTGEGNQSYGYGLYLAEEPNVAKQYASGGGGFISTQGKDNIYFNGNWIQNFSDKKSAEGLAKYSMSQSAAGITVPEKIETLKKLGRQDAAEWLEKNQNKFSVSQGSLYKVDLPDAKIEQMLDWDKPISQQPAMQKAFDKFWKGLSKNERAQTVFDEFGDYDLAEQMAKSPGEVRGRLAYTLMTHHFGDQAAASDFLRQQGVPGIKYFDAGSRDGGKGTRNFVVFPGEEQHLTILERN